MKYGLSGVLLLGLELGGARNALAAPEGERRAAESFRQAQAAFARRDYAAAAAAFEKAAELNPHPAPLLDAAQAWVLAKDFVRAAEDCDRVLALPSLGEGFSRAARDELERILPRIATLHLDGPRTLAARVDEGPEVGVPTRKRMAPGHHTVVVVDLASTTTRTLDVELAPGDARALDLTPASRPRIEDPVRPPAVAKSEGRSLHEEPRSGAVSGLRAAAWISLGASAVAVGAATVFGIMTVESKNDYGAVPNTTTQSAFYRNRLVTNVTIVSACVGLGAGFVFWRLSPQPAPTRSVAVAPATDGGRVIATVWF